MTENTHNGSISVPPSVPIRKNMSWVRQIQDINKACDGDQMDGLQTIVGSQI